VQGGAFSPGAGVEIEPDAHLLAIDNQDGVHGSELASRHWSRSQMGLCSQLGVVEPLMLIFELEAVPKGPSIFEAAPIAPSAVAEPIAPTFIRTRPDGCRRPSGERPIRSDLGGVETIRLGSNRLHCDRDDTLSAVFVSQSFL
jgi:hypothetical protein